MDAVELPLPANVVVSKLLASDGFVRVGEPESRDSAGASSCSTHRRDTKCPLTISEYGSVSRSKKTDADLCLHESMLPSFKCEENGRRNHLGEADSPILLLPKHEGKPLNRKSFKKLSSFPCSKRPRTDKPDDSIMTAGADDCSARKIGYDLTRCTSDEKSRMVKQKRGQDSKMTDKKNFRASVKTKYDPFTSKAGFISSDSVSGGNDILGLYGLKSDLHDVIKHVEELSLNELLDGSYKYPNLCSEKGKKASNINENILLSVRKACSILPLHGAADSGGNSKALMGLLNPSFSSANMLDSDDKDKCTEELFSKVQDPCQANFSGSTLYHPKDILKRLALPPPQDLETLILNLSMNSFPSQSTMHMKDFHAAGLPPFPWSFSHSGACKPCVDSSRLALTRNTCQGKWVRIGSSSTSTGDDHNCFSDLELKTLDHNDASMNQRKIDDLLQDVKMLSESIKPPFDGPLNTLESHILDSANLFKESGASGSYNSRKLKLLDEHADSSDAHVEYDSKDHVFLRTSESEVGLRCLGNKLKLVDPSRSNLRFKHSEVGQKEQPTRSADGCSGSCDSYPCKSFACGCGQSLWHSPAPETSKQGHSPRLLTAAAILCEIASCSNAIRTQNDTSGRIKWPQVPSQKTMKACKLVSSVEKKNRLFPASRQYDPIKPTSVKDKVKSEKKTDFTHMDNAGREPVRWSFSAEGGASPGKLERDHLTVNQRPLNGNSFRPLGPMPSPTRVGKVYDNQQKLRKATLKASSVAFEGTYIKDWNRGRNKRV